MSQTSVSLLSDRNSILSLRLRFRFLYITTHFSVGDLIEAVGCGGGMVGTIQQIQLAALTPWRAGPPRKKDEKSLYVYSKCLKKDKMVTMSITLIAD